MKVFLRFVRGLLLLLFFSGSALAHPGAAIAVGPDGRVYFVDTGRGVFVIGPDGLRRHDGPAFHWFALDPTSRFAATSWPSIPGAEIRSVGRKPTLILSSDFPVVVGRDGAFYYPEPQGEGRLRLIRITPSGSRSVHIVLPEERRPDGSIASVNGFAARADGSLYYSQDKTVRRIGRRGDVTTVAANVAVSQCVPIPGTEPELRPYLRGLDVAADGTVYVAAAGCGAVLKIAPTGGVSTILRSESPFAPTAVALFGGEVFVLEYLNTASDDRREWLPRIRKVRRDGSVVVVTLAGATR